MENCLKFYIDGAWVEPSDPKPFDVINPANEQVIGQIMLGNENDVNKAVAAAKKAFLSFSRCSVEERLELLDFLDLFIFIGSQRSRRHLESFLEPVRFILTEHGLVPSHMDLIRTDVLDF